MTAMLMSFLKTSRVKRLGVIRFLRSGALPRMSKSVREMVKLTGIVEEAFVGPAGQQTGEVDKLDRRESITGEEYENENSFFIIFLYHQLSL